MQAAWVGARIQGAWPARHGIEMEIKIEPAAAANDVAAKLGGEEINAAPLHIIYSSSRQDPGTNVAPCLSRINWRKIDLIKSTLRRKRK